MGRVVEPLARDGRATSTGASGGTRAPLAIRGGPLRGMRHELAGRDARR